MLSLAQTVLTLATVVQVRADADQPQPSPTSGWRSFGTDLGIWIAKAARVPDRCQRGEALAVDGAGIEGGGSISCKYLIKKYIILGSASILTRVSVRFSGSTGKIPLE